MEIKVDMDEKSDNTIYTVVVNHKEQYAIWFADREPPIGWKEVGKTGPRAECLAYIKAANQVRLRI